MTKIQIIGAIRNVSFLCLILFSLVSAKESCAVFDAFKVLPENTTNYVGGAFCLHKQNCAEIISESVQEIVAFQWVLGHWNTLQKDATSQVGLFVGDSCSRPKETVLQTLRFLDFINYYEPKECLKKPKNGSMIGILSPKDRESASALAGLLKSTDLLVGAYTSESVEALLEGGVKRVLTTSAIMEDYIMAFSALMSSIESDLVILVTCDEVDPRSEAVLRLLSEQEIHTSEVIHLGHKLLVDVLKNTDSNILLYLPCERETNSTLEIQEISNGPKLLITIGINDADAHFPYRINNAQELIIRQIKTEVPLFKPYFLRILINNYDTYALASSYIQQLINCSFSKKTCPDINLESLNNVYVQGKNVDSIVRLAYAFSVASRFVDVDDKLKAACVKSNMECVDGIFKQLSSMRFVNEKRSPLELANEELGFFAKSPNLLQAIGIRLEAVLAGSDEVFKYLIAREPKLISKGLPTSIRSIRSVCQPYNTYCGNCNEAVLADPKTTFLNNQFIAPFYLAGLFDLHEIDCQNVKQESIIDALAFTYTLNTVAEKYPKLALKPLKDYGVFLFDSCSDSYRARQFTINTETQCLKLPLTEYNVSIPAATILGYVNAALQEEPDNQGALLRGMHIPSVTMNLPSDHQNGVIGLLSQPKRVAKAVLEFFNTMQWSYISVIVSSSDSRSMANFEAFKSLSSEYDICVGNVLFYSPLNRTRLSSHDSSSNVTLFFTTSSDANEFISTRLRFNVELTNNVDVMVNGAQDFLIHESNLLQHSGTIAIRPKDIIPREFKEYLQTVTPLSLPEQWFWNYVENQWRCALSLNNKDQYDGRLCTGNEHLNLLGFGQLSSAGLLIRGIERLVLALDSAYRKACNSDSNVGYCDAFMTNGRKLVRQALDEDDFRVDFQVDEFQPIDHHGNLGYKLIGNFTADMKYVEVEQYKKFISGIPKYDVVHKSSCNPPLCVCKQRDQRMSDDVLSTNGNGGYGSIKWFHADKSALLFDWENSTLNYVFIGITTTIILLATATLFLVLYKIYSRAIKGNQSLGIFSLGGIILMCLTAYLYVLDNMDQLYDLRILLNYLSHVICFGLVLIKAVRLRNFEDISNKGKVQIGMMNYGLLLLFIISVQLAIFLRSFYSGDSQEKFAQGYTSFLLLISLLINVMNRKIARNFQESTWLFVTNIFAMAIYTIWIVCRSLFDSVYTRQIDISELLCTSLVLLIFLFGPKLYILFMYQSVVVERAQTPIKLAVYDDDLFTTGSPNLSSSRSNMSQKGSIGNKSPSSGTTDEFPVLKTVMRKREFAPSKLSSNRHSDFSSSSN